MCGCKENHSFLYEIIESTRKQHARQHWKLHTIRFQVFKHICVIGKLKTPFLQYSEASISNELHVSSKLPFRIPIIKKKMQIDISLEKLAWIFVPSWDLPLLVSYRPQCFPNSKIRCNSERCIIGVIWVP